MTAPVTASHEAASGLPRGRRCAPTVRSRPIYHPVRQASTRPRRRRIQLQAATEPVTAADVQSPPCGTPEPNRGPPSPGDAAPAKGRRKAKRTIASLKEVRQLRPTRTEIIVCTGLRIKGGVQIWGDIATGLFCDRKQKR